MHRVLTVATKNPALYEDALRAAGLEPVYDASINDVDGLLLQGGTDINPDLYGEEPDPETGEPEDERDEHELWLINDALERDMPILAICRGMQILNVAHGGTLIQHITGHEVRGENPALPVHPLKVKAGSLLAGIAPGEVQANSRHHQAVGKVGGGLIVSGRAPDGIVEAIERPDKPFVLGVQWHPEDQPDHAWLFQAFAAAISSRGSTSTSTSKSCSAPPSSTP